MHHSQLAVQCNFFPVNTPELETKPRNEIYVHNMSIVFSLVLVVVLDVLMADFQEDCQVIHIYLVQTCENVVSAYLNPDCFVDVTFRHILVKKSFILLVVAFLPSIVSQTGTNKRISRIVFVPLNLYFGKGHFSTTLKCF